MDSVRAVHRALYELGYQVVRIPLSPPLENARDKLKSLRTDIVFNLFEGFEGNPESEAIIREHCWNWA